MKAIKFKKIFIIMLLAFLIIFINSYLYISCASDTPTISNTATCYVIDNWTNKALFSKNEKQKMYPASTTKIVTAIIVLENCNLNDKTTASYNAISTIPQGYVTADIQIGEEFTIEQLLELLLVHSANDAANVLAEYVGGSVQSFVSMMNTKVNELGLSDTHFTNPYGLQDENHYTTAYDLAYIMKYCLQNETFRKISGKASCAIPATNMSEPRKYNSTNELLIAGNDNYYQYASTGKTGFTSQAKECLVSSAYNNDLEVICVILGSDNRFLDTRNVYDYIFSNYKIENIYNENDVITTITVKNATNDTKNLNLLISEDLPVLVNTSNDFLTDATQVVVTDDEITAPIREGQILGKVTYNLNGVSYTSDLIAANDVEKSNLITYIIYGSTISIVIILFIVIFKLSKSKKGITKTIEITENENDND